MSWIQDSLDVDRDTYYAELCDTGTLSFGKFYALVQDAAIAQWDNNLGARSLFWADIDGQHRIHTTGGSDGHEVCTVQIRLRQGADWVLARHPPPGMRYRLIDGSGNEAVLGSPTEVMLDSRLSVSVPDTLTPGAVICVWVHSPSFEPVTWAEMVAYLDAIPGAREIAIRAETGELGDFISWIMSE